MSDRLDTLRIFCAAAEASSFREAATRLGISPQAVTRAVQELEQQLGELLFHRSTRRVQITGFGEQFAERARDTLLQVDGLFSADEARARGIAGTVRMTAPVVVGRNVLARPLGEMAADNPQVSLDLRLSNPVSDVVDEKIDVGVRVGFVRDNRFVARQAGRYAFVVAATPALIARVGKPTRVDALSQLPLTAVPDWRSGRLWPWYFAGGEQLMPTQPVFVSDDAEVELEAVLAGVGFGQVPLFLAAPHIRAGRLVTVLDRQAPDPWDIYVYRPQRGPVPARIRLVFDRCVAVLSDPAVLPVRL